jgi:hypothetical protein
MDNGSPSVGKQYYIEYLAKETILDIFQYLDYFDKIDTNIWYTNHVGYREIIFNYEIWKYTHDIILNCKNITRLLNKCNIPVPRSYIIYQGKELSVITIEIPEISKNIRRSVTTFTCIDENDITSIVETKFFHINEYKYGYKHSSGIYIDYYNILNHNQIRYPSNNELLYPPPGCIIDILYPAFFQNPDKKFKLIPSKIIVGLDGIIFLEKNYYIFNIPVGHSSNEYFIIIIFNKNYKVYITATELNKINFGFVKLDFPNIKSTEMEKSKKYKMITIDNNIDNNIDNIKKISLIEPLITIDIINDIVCKNYHSI